MRCYRFQIFLVVGLAALLIQGCGGHKPKSVVTGTVSDMNQNVVIDADVWHDELIRTKSLASGAYRLEDVPSGWRTIRASATIGGRLWMGSTAVEVLRDEPTMNVNIILMDVQESTDIRGIVRDDTGFRVNGARVFVSLRPEGTGQIGPYGSIVAVTDSRGEYVLEDVPTGVRAVISASKVGFTNDEVVIATVTTGISVDFELQRSNLTEFADAPTLDAIESYTMPDSIVRGDSAFDAIRAFTSPRFRQALAKRTPNATSTRATPEGSLIEIDLYWTDPNLSKDIAGYGIYRGTTTSLSAIDFVRDPYAIFYGDAGAEITPGRTYYYAVTAVDVEFLDEFNRPDPNAESDLSNTLSVVPMGQLSVISPGHGAEVSSVPTFAWRALAGAAAYSVYVYDEFPTLPLDPGVDYGTDPAQFLGTLPIWPTTGDPNGSTVGAGATSIVYDGPPLVSGHTYYWVVLAQDDSGAAFSYGDLRPFTVR